MSDYELMVIISLVVVIIFMSMIIARINQVDNRVDELSKMTLGLEKLNAERNEKNLKHMIDIVDKAIKNLDELIESEE